MDKEDECCNMENTDLTFKPVKYNYVTPSTHFFNTLDQILIYLKRNNTIDKNHLIAGIDNTIKEGYVLEKQKPQS